MVRYCANCGTEVDETAVFCPTCGQPIEQDAETEMPAAPAWPASEPSADAADEPSTVTEPPPAPPATSPPAAVVHEEPTRAEPRVEAPPPAAPPPPQPRPPAERQAMQIPFTTPVTLSSWLIGVGAAVASLGAFIGLFDGSGVVIDLLAFVTLAAVAATVFFPSALPAIPHLRFITLAVVLLTFGAGLDRLGFGRAGAGDLLLFLGAAAATIGAVILELGHDQPIGGPQT